MVAIEKLWGKPEARDADRRGVLRIISNATATYQSSFAAFVATSIN